MTKLIYSLTSHTSSNRTLSIQDYLTSVGLVFDGIMAPNLSHPDNYTVPSILFIMGLLLGDGSLTIRLRLVTARKGSIWIIPLVRVSQADIPVNSHFFSMLSSAFTSFGADSAFTNATVSSRGMGEFYSEGVNNVFGILLPLLSAHPHFMYWKAHRFELMQRLATLMASSLHNTHFGLIAALNLIYSYPNERTTNLEY